MVYRFASLIGLICSIASATGITPHEQIVRKAYAKLAFATQTAAVQKWTVERRTPASNNDYGALISFVAEQKASFAISNFKTGSVKQPLPEHGTVNAIVTRPSGQVLRMAFATTTYKTASGPVALVSVQPRWATLPYLAQDWDIPFTKAVQDFDPAGLYTSYASFDVTVTCRQVSRTYAAAFLFAEGPDGIRAVEPLDYIVGGTVLKQVSDAAISPMPLLVSAIPSQEFFRWFVSVTPGSRGCADLGDGLCCDWDNLQCGFTEDAVAKAAETTAVIVPLEPVNSCSEYNAWAPPISSSDSNDQQHVWGDHGASVTFRSACTYTDVSQPGPGQPCWTDCSVTPDGPNYWEGGYVALFYHAGNESIRTITGSAYGGSAQCDSTYAVGIASCLTPICSISVTITGYGSVSFSPSPLWQFTRGHQHWCIGKSIT